MTYQVPDSDPDLAARRASSFGASAAAYADERPDYPAAAVRWALEPVAGRAPLRVLDLAAGTGKLTEVLLNDGVPAGRITAVEPDPGMREEFARRVPGVRMLAGGAEEIPLPDAAVDAVLVGQAMHWFDHERALPEIHRVLAPGGVLAALWNTDVDTVPWVAGLKAASRSSVSFQRKESETLPATKEFPAYERREFPHAHRRTAESMAATIGTHSHMLVLEPDERDAVLAAIVGYLRSVPETADGEFDYPLLTLTLRATRS